MFVIPKFVKSEKTETIESFPSEEYLLSLVTS